MATKHWARDANITDPANYRANGNQPREMALVYHFLRNAGFSLKWECDGEVYDSQNAICNHVDDGSMEASGTASYAAVAGGVVAKDTTTVRSGKQSLSVLSITPGDGVQTVALRDMRRAGVGNVSGSAPNLNMGVFNYHSSDGVQNAPSPTITISGAIAFPGNNGTFPISSVTAGLPSYIHFTNAAGGGESGLNWATNEPYELDFWAENLSPGLWNVEVDDGSGGWTLLGTIPVIAGWQQYHFSFTLATGSGARYIRFVDPATGSGAQLFIDSLRVYRSLFEDESGFYGNQYGTDGILTNPDQFSTAGSYAPGLADVGKWLFMWDTTNPANSGWYKIIADLGGGSVQVDLRSPTAAFVNAGSLNYRIVDVEGFWLNDNYGYDRWTPAFMLESPHASKWRFVCRMAQRAGQNSKGMVFWGAPSDTDFDVDTGWFFDTGPHTGSRPEAGPFEWYTFTHKHLHSRGAYTYKTSPTLTRTFLMTDEDLSFFHVFHWDDDTGKHGSFFVGLTGTDPNRPGDMEWMLGAGFDNTLGSADETAFDGVVQAWTRSGTGIGDNGKGVEVTFGADMGYASSSHLFKQSNGKANPWSGKEWLQKPIVALDPLGVFNRPAEGDADCGIYRTRNTMSELVTFDGDSYLHLANGLVWEWSGEQLAP